MRKRKNTEFLTPELTPLIDVVFILLVFFIVSSVFKKKDLAFLLNLPKTESGEHSENKTKDYTIEVKMDNYALNGKEYDLDGLKNSIKSLDKDKVIFLRADKDVVYNRVVELFDILNKEGLKKISLITQKKKNQ